MLSFVPISLKTHIFLTYLYNEKSTMFQQFQTILNINTLK